MKEFMRIRDGLCDGDHQGFARWRSPSLAAAALKRAAAGGRDGSLCKLCGPLTS